MKRVQSLQNDAARLVTGARRRDHITLVLCQLHWLPVRRRVEFIGIVRSNAYLVSTWLMTSISSPKATDDPFGLPLITCARYHVRTSFGDRSVGAVGPRFWNSLPRGLRTLDISYKHFKALLKTLCFDKVTALLARQPRDVWLDELGTGSPEMNENICLPGTPSACRHREVPPNSTNIGYLITAQHQKHKRQTFSPLQ